MPNENKIFNKKFEKFKKVSYKYFHRNLHFIRIRNLALNNTPFMIEPKHSSCSLERSRLFRKVLVGVFSKKMSRSSRPEVFCKKDVLINFVKFTGKHPRTPGITL